jgi:hypothetical protein
MKKIIKQSDIQKQIKSTTEHIPYNRVEIYDLHQVLLLGISCERCANKEHCSGTEPKCMNCEIDEAIVESGVFDIQAQIQGTGKSKYYVYTDDYESLDVTNSAVKKIIKQYSR